jgi:exodeoxyribonuclease-3
MISSHPLKVATWNVNGLRARAAQLSDWLQIETPDVVCLQEIRVTLEQVPPDLWARTGYHCFWHGGGKGYSGVALLISERLGVPTFFHPDFDFESRIVGAQLGDHLFYSVYVPNGGKDFAAKMRFLQAVENHLEARAREGMTVVLGGDLNVARSEFDVHPKERKSKPVIGQLPEERELFERILSGGYVDVQRFLHPDDPDLFTWWAPWRNLRQRNIGWRIDYLLASQQLAARAISCVCQREVGTSDHGPLVGVFGASEGALGTAGG